MSKTMLVSIPVEMLHSTNCFYLIAPMRNAKGEYGYVASPLAYEMLASQCRPIHDMMREATEYYEDIEDATQVLKETEEGAPTHTLAEVMRQNGMPIHNSDSNSGDGNS